MASNTIEPTLRSYIAENFLFSDKGYPYSDEASFLAEGIVDSLNIMELVMFIEEKYGLKIADQEIMPDNFDSVSRLAAYIRHKQGIEA